jgi:site-specific DNA-methyltransferase (adenine-specific)
MKIGEFELNKIYCMDCLEGLKKLPDKSVDLVVTDPPYGINYKSNAGKTNKFDVIQGDDGIDLEPIIKEIFRVMKDNTCLYCFCRYDIYSNFFLIISKYFNVKNCLIWEKSKALGGLGDITSSYINNFELIIFAHKGRRILWDGGFNREFGLIKDDSINKPTSLVHPTQKPIPILRGFINNCSNKEDIVLDPFMGSGTTAVACKQLGRNFIGFEISPEYCEIANKRLQQ